LFLVIVNPGSGRLSVERNYGSKNGFPADWINDLFQTSDGALWAASNRGLISLIPTTDAIGFRFRLYSRQNGLTYREVKSLAEDRSGNLWLGMLNGGATRVARTGITVFGQADGFAWANSILTDRNGDLLVIAGPHDDSEGRTVNRFDGEQFSATTLDVPKTNYGWGWNQILVNDHNGEWWLATTQGLMRFPNRSLEQLARTRPNAIYTTQNGLASDAILRVFEDSTVGERFGLSRWDQATGSFHHYRGQDGLPLADAYPTAFCEDTGGNVWIGFSVGGGLLRYRNGRFDAFKAAEGLPEGGILNLFLDSTGRLWVPTARGGVWRIDNPTVEHPTGRAYSSADGISSNSVLCVTEDQWGRIYLGTGRGIDRLDLASGSVKHYSDADGVLPGDMLAALKDRDGSLWFASANGLMRLVPKPDLPPLQPAILITGLRIAGMAYPISAIGESQVGPLALDRGKNNIEIRFVGLGLGDGEDLKYQYSLDSANRDWSPPNDQRTLDFADLAPGRYRLQVRAITPEGAISGIPATLSFRVLPPFWQRWWFLAIVTTIVALLAYGWYRYRVAQLLEIARVRARISGDLHDDIGANLSRIAILSEVAHQQMTGERGLADSSLSSIADISRESVASMRDIVWAVNPNRDRLFDLTQRMRGFASDVFAIRDIAFQFEVPGHDVGSKLRLDIRRDVFLIFKEAVNNAVRHSGCSNARVHVSVEYGWLKVELNDNGIGIDPDSAGEGQGLSSMRRRAEKLGGELEIISSPGEGTAVRLRVPITSRSRFRKSRPIPRRPSTFQA
ncbi:MAG: sensor histidine kinase, partial [Blastocatellia bacterium]